MFTAPRFDPTRGAVRAAVEIAAPPDAVFRALVDPEQLAAWWGSADTYRTRDWRVDPRPGGAWSVRTTDASGAEGSVRGEYRVVDPPRLLEHSWRASWDPAVTTTVRYELEPALVDGVPGTRLTVTHGGFGAATACAALGGAARMTDAAWARRLAALARHLSLVTAAGVRSFVCVA